MRNWKWTGVGSLILLVGTGDFCMATERSTYFVELSAPPCEIRDYGPKIIAVVDVGGDRSHAVSSGFRILANYIFGNNARKDSIAMTAPVGQEPLASGWNVSFTMPAAYTLNTLPTPNDSRVHVVTVHRHRVAVIQFSGFWSDANLKSHEKQLVQWLQGRKLVAVGPPTYAYYDPPWTPWFLRTIEVMIDIN